VIMDTLPLDRAIYLHFKNICFYNTSSSDKTSALFYATLLVLPVCISMTNGGTGTVLIDKLMTNYWAGVSQFFTASTSHWTYKKIFRNVHDLGDFLEIYSKKIRSNFIDAKNLLLIFKQQDTITVRNPTVHNTEVLF
jgi:hypothetical protein